MCQLPLASAAEAGDPLAAALLGDLLRWGIQRAAAGVPTRSSTI